jgi:hypothetical protein
MRSTRHGLQAIIHLPSARPDTGERALRIAKEHWMNEWVGQRIPVLRERF